MTKNKQRGIQVRYSLAFIAATAVFLFLYVVWVAIDFHIQHASKESVRLSEYTNRSISRLQTNPDGLIQWSQSTQGPSKDRPKSLGSLHLNTFKYYAELQEIFPSIPELEDIQNNKLFIHILAFNGFFSPPSYVIVNPVVTDSGERFFGYLHIEEPLGGGELKSALAKEIQPALFIALTAIIGMFLFQLKQIHAINTSAMDMAEWADNLHTTSTQSHIPNFQLPRLNHIAFTINKSLETFNQVLEQEQSFTKFTSHELRTPIAAMSANIEILEMMMQDLSPQERQVLKRMETAVSDMKYQIEALLWMSKENEISKDKKKIILKETIKKSIEDNAYLRKNKNIAIDILGEDHSFSTHPVLFQIIINNLIRNAFQNTIDGEVIITLDDTSIHIENKNNSREKSSDESFGIGLVLVEKLLKKLNISSNTEILSYGRKVSLQLM